MWVVAGKVAAKAATKVVAKKAAGGQTPKKKRWPLYLAIVGGVGAIAAIAMLLVGNMVSAFITVITGTTVAATDCGVDRGRLSAFGEAGGSLSGVTAGSFAIPMAAGSYTISSGWGMRDGENHNGTDFAAPAGTPIYAAADGEVTIAGPLDGYGHAIVIQHNLNGQRVDTLYGHMYSYGVLVKVGDKVRGGQHIAVVGSDGFSSGPHLHLSVHPGGYTGYSSGVDPMPWLKQDLPADSTLAAARPDFTPIQPNAPPGTSPFAALAAPAAKMAALPASKGTEAGMQVDGVRVMRATSAKFPDVTTIGGLRPGDSGDHGSGRAVDIMVPNFESPEGKALGDQIVDYFQANATFFQVDYLIWQQRIWQNGTWSPMEDRGSPTDNHFDHVHVSVTGGGTPSDTTDYGNAPGVTPNSPTVLLAANTSTTTTECVKPPTTGGGLADGSVPEKYRAAVLAAGAVCPEITPPVIAAQLEQESGWREEVISAGDGVNDGGAMGMAQFMPGTWATMGVDSGVDKDGRPNGPDAPDAFNPFDAIAAQAKYMCYIVDQLKPHIASGKVKGDIVDLALAGYNAGEGAVLEYGGIPPYSQTQAYVPGIRARMAKYEASMNAPAPGGGGGGPAITVAGSPFARAMIEAASRQQGLPYVWGGGGPDGPTAGQGSGELGFDCSGLVLYGVARASGGATILPRTTHDQVNTGTAVSKQDIQPGDAVFSNNTGHVAIWLGDGKVLEAQTFGVPVGIHPFDLNNAENIRRFG